MKLDSSGTWQDHITFGYDQEDHNILETMDVTGQATTYFGYDSGKRWRETQGPSTNPDSITYAYTGTGRLATYQREAEAAEPAVSAAYTYDAAGQRTTSTVTIDGVVSTTEFTYTGLALHKLEATRTQGEVTESWSLTYLYDEYGKPYAGVYRSPQTSEDPTVFSMVTSDRGDVLALLDENGYPFAAYRYDAWGSPLGQGNAGDGIWAQATSQGETETISLELAATIATRQVLRYAGYCYDPESGLYYLSARHYDPATRQFLSKDLSRNDGEQSAYGYCLGNPIANVDPTGLVAVAYAPGARKERNPQHVSDRREADWSNPANRVDANLRVVVVESADIAEHPGGFLGYKVGDVVVTYRCQDESPSGSNGIAYVVIAVDSYGAVSEDPDVLDLWNGTFTEVVRTADITHFEARPLRPSFTQYVFHADLLSNPDQEWSSWSPRGVTYQVHVDAYDRNGGFVEHVCAITEVSWPLCDSQGLLLEIMTYVDLREGLFGPK